MCDRYRSHWASAAGHWGAATHAPPTVVGRRRQSPCRIVVAAGVVVVVQRSAWRRQQAWLRLPNRLIIITIIIAIMKRCDGSFTDEYLPESLIRQPAGLISQFERENARTPTSMPGAWNA